MLPDKNPHRLPAGVRSGHVEHRVSLPHPYTVRCLLGQLVDVRDDLGNRFLLVESDTHWHLHRRLNPTARGHARNQVHPEPHFSLPKADGRR